MNNILDDFFSWLRVHSMGYRMRHDAMGWEIDYGYIKACDVVKCELERLVEEQRMESTELNEIKDYWTTKYPHISISLYPKAGNGKYCGKMMTHNDSFDLNADTIGELISQGESFLRKVSN